MPAQAPSLVYRLVIGLVAASIVLSGAAAAALDALIRSRAIEARHEVLVAQVIALIATAELEAPDALRPATLAEARLSTPGSGLYAEIRAADGSVIWRSPSTVGSRLELAARPLPGERAFEQVRLADGTRVLGLSLGVSWETGSGAPRLFFISAAESLEPHFHDLARVRLWLLSGAVVLMTALALGLTFGLRVGLRPLRRLEHEIAEVEAGRRDVLGGRWPRELAGVTANLNALLDGERARLARYRTTLGNLAHSLKTPIAALKTIVSGSNEDVRRACDPQLDRMRDIVDHQLRRAVLGGAGSTVASVAVGPPLAELGGALGKVYADKAVFFELDVPAGLAYPMDPGDLMELAGNLLDNAFKYGRGHVRLTARPTADVNWRRPGLCLVIDDDGPGIPPADRDRVLQRGVRADETVAGQGIGLAAAREVAAAYGGALRVVDSPLGGARLSVDLPGR